MLLDSQLFIAPTGKTISPPHRRLSPIPMPPGYHQHQFPSMEVPPSRPMSPGEQFGSIGVHDRWMEDRAGEPSDSDVKVQKNVQQCSYMCCNITRKLKFSLLT